MMDGALTGKTGFTGKAGYCYVGALKDGERTFVIALLACGWPNNKTYKWSDARALFSYGLSAYQYDTLTFPENFGEVAVEEGILPGQGIDETAEVPLLLSGEKSLQLLLSGKDEVKLQVTLPRSLAAPVAGRRGGRKGGSLTEWGRDRRLSDNSGKTVKKKDFSWCFLKIFEQYLEL